MWHNHNRLEHVILNIQLWRRILDQSDYTVGGAIQQLLLIYCNLTIYNCYKFMEMYVF